MLFYSKYNMLCHMAVPRDYRRMVSRYAVAILTFREDDEKGRVLWAL